MLCAPLQPIAGHAEFVEILAWVTCEVGFNPLPVPGVFPALTGVPKADDDSLYVVYLPRSVTIVDGGCDYKLSAYHFFGAVPDIDMWSHRSRAAVADIRSPWFRPLVQPGSTPEQFGTGSPGRRRRDHRGGHPLVATGWNNNSIVTDSDDGFFATLVDSFSNISTDLKAGEVADICEEGGTLTGPPSFQHPTPSIPIPASIRCSVRASSSRRTGRTSRTPARRSCRGAR